MSSIEISISQAKKYLAENDAKEALKVLKPFKKSLKTSNPPNLELYQIFAESYLENGQVDKAYPLLVKSCELDPEGRLGGSDKFFTLGQIAGGEDGISLLVKGIESVSTQAGDELKQEQAEKIVGGLLSMIEIWMTDLCMEPNAESQCEELIGKAMEVSDNQSPEAWAMLGSIRISQQRFGDAAEAFSQSWHFFQEKKDKIETGAQQGFGNLHIEFVNLLQPLLNLAKMCVELGLYDTALEIEGAIKDIDEDNLEGIYLEGFTHYLICKLEQFKSNNPAIILSPENIYEFNGHFQDMPLDLANIVTQDRVKEARLLLTYMVKLAEQGDSKDEIVSELLQGAEGLLSELGGPAHMSELIKFRKGDEVADDEEVEIDNDDI
ncbi:LADA_0G06128g1_1 [Lachancea dasiensis]|uniref:LADA_0G06128g1_1 n=1 Tax=Lachancea dasiensis TaxID=1072105 RepID=A0A1G4JT45_9SACH|nr:LADA_0G06128g1_1 [Lachancea dasiensis]